MSTSSAHARWSAALDELEAELVRTDAFLRDVGGTGTVATTSAWTLPDLLGPLPATLLARARSVQQRQQEVLAGLGTAMVGVRRQRDLLASGGRTGARGAAAFVDQAF
jgi:hypothetical protein